LGGLREPEQFRSIKTCLLFIETIYDDHHQRDRLINGHDWVDNKFMELVLETEEEKNRILLEGE
jgi:hypothetical protein